MMLPMKTIKYFCLFSLATLLLISLPSRVEGAASTKEVTDKLEELFQASRKVNAPGDEKQKARTLIENSMDWEKIAQLCLGSKQAKKNAGKNLDSFKNLLKEVVIKTAYTRLDKFWDGNTKYQFENIELKGNTAKVPTKFFVKGEPAMLEYFLSKKGDQWLIYDISYEEIRYSTNISEQIDAFLKEGNFASLLDKLKKRRDELVEETSKPKKVSESNS
jgi:ABC-type transporter MlaC component